VTARASLSGDVFLVDDNPVNLRRLAEILKGAGVQVRAATSGARALDAIRAHPPDLVLLDVEMPGKSGYEVCEALAADPATRGLCVVFVSAHDSPFEKTRAFLAGGADYLTKPFDAEEVLARVATQLAVVRLTRENEALKAELSRAREPGGRE
jgi:two-component system sensor histidine kinase/response regulator